MKKLVRYLSALILFGLVSGCGLLHKRSKASVQKTGVSSHVVVTVRPRSHTTHLYYNATLSPLSTVSVVSPVDGVVKRLEFRYGDSVKKGQVLAYISSEKLSSDYRQAINDFFTKQDAVQAAKESFDANKALRNFGVISDNTFKQSASSYRTAELSFYQAQSLLKKILGQVGIPLDSVKSLSLQDTTQIDALLARKFQALPVVSAASGVALFPSSQGDGGDGKAVSVGTDVKKGQVLVSLGNLDGFSTQVQVSELNVNRVKPGQKVTVTGVAFPGITLHGKVVSVASQAQASQSGMSSLAMFQVHIDIPNVSRQQVKKIHVGMSAKLDLAIKDKPEIFIPIQAVFQKDGKSMVKLQSGKSVEVTTGETTETDVEVLSGLKTGDKVVYRAQS